MAKKRVLIASFVLIIAGLFLILGTQASITGAAVGVQTEALNTESKFIFGFFLIFIASFMLIVNATALEDIVNSTKNIQKHASDQPATKSMDDYLTKIKEFGLREDGEIKSYQELNEQQKQELMDHVMFGKAGRYFKKFRNEIYDTFVNADLHKKLDYLRYYEADSGVKRENIIGTYEQRTKEGIDPTEIEIGITKEEMKGLQSSNLRSSFDYLKRQPSKIEEIINGINSEMGWHYKPEYFKQTQNEEVFQNVVGKYLTAKDARTERESLERQSGYQPNRS
jgi:hypothetical protein